MNNRFHAGHMILFSGAMILLFIFILLYAFIKKDVSMVTDEYYAQELEYDHLQEAMHLVLPYDSLFQIQLKPGSIELTIPDQINKLLTGCTVQLYCPSNEIYDKLYHLKPGVSNTYALDCPLMHQALVLKIYLQAGAVDYYKEMKI